MTEQVIKDLQDNWNSIGFLGLLRVLSLNFCVTTVPTLIV